MLPHFKEKRMSIDTEVVIDEKIKLEDRLPSKYNVVMLNDEHTPIEFVIGILEMIFRLFWMTMLSYHFLDNGILYVIYTD